MSDSVARFTISVAPELLSRFDEVSAGKGYASRSEAVRDAMRDYLVAHEWTAQGDAGEVVGTVTLVYDLESHGLFEELRERRRREGVQVLACMEVHLDPRNCLELLVVRGPHAEIAVMADELISLRGVKHGTLVSTTTGATLV